MLEGLLTHVMIRMEDAGVVKRKLFHACMKLARRVGTRILDGESVGLWDRLRYALGNALIYGPLRNALGMSRVRVAPRRARPSARTCSCSTAPSAST